MKTIEILNRLYDITVLNERMEDLTLKLFIDEKSFHLGLSKLTWMGYNYTHQALCARENDQHFW